jgi:2-polyprenyl-6-methoxyphenol hydroxylase-like FAD-dependent oxidoreductase
VADTSLRTRCCIAGGGPAGLMLGLLVARAGVDVTVLEKHGDFLRDFRGDTVHPSTLEVIHELGWLDEFLARPHDKARNISVMFGDTRAMIADFTRLKARCGFIAMMPQWEFLDFLRDHAVLYPGFRLLLDTEVASLVESTGPSTGLRTGRVTGVLAKGPEGEVEIQADLVIGADGRRSKVREAAGLVVRNLGAPIDVLWMRIGKRASDPSGSGGRIGTGRFMAMIDRGDYWQCAYLIAKGGIEQIRSRGLESFRRDVAALAPIFADRIEGDLKTWDDVKLLSVAVDRLEQWWKPGLLCIGDAAHAMSPIGGVGINLAIQDAVAAANILAAPLADDSVTPDAITSLLAQVQQRRMFPTRVTQAVQVAAQNGLINPLLSSSKTPEVPFAIRMLNRFPVLRGMPAYAVGMGARPEHVRSPEAPRTA